VRTVTLNRPEKRNALNGEMLDLLTVLFRQEPAPQERVTVLRGAGSVFCAGLDLRERLDSPPTAGESVIEPMLDAVQRHPLPVVAVVQGDAIAGGNELALHCDLVIASTAANFGMFLAQIGLAPTWFLGKKLMDVCGPVLSREILLLGDPIPASRMADAGAILDAVAPQHLEAAVTRVVDRLAANAPLSLKAMKALVLQQLAVRDGIDHGDVDELVRAASTSEDASEGIAARLQRRPANFIGR
jgi:enoyl-CoA hydratase/carnithine racemase